jgi:3-oxoacyl-[acyl-carrier-protein] synthase-3
MARSVIVGSGKAIPPNCVTNAMLARVMDTSDQWIRERSGVETRYYVDPGTGTSDLGARAATEALETARVARDEVDLVLGLRSVPCFDIRQQCVGFLYGLQLADAHIRAGLARTVLLVGAEIHTGFMPYTHANWEYMYGRSDVPPTPEEWAFNTRFRHLVVLFGDAAAAVVIRAADEGERGIVDTVLHGDGAEYEKLYVPGTGFKHRPYTDPDQFRRGDHIPVMDGRYVFKMATTRMLEAAQEVLERNRLRPQDLSLVLMHQANLRINEYCQKALGLPDEKVPNNIQRYGNTTAATIPLLWDECVRDGRLRPGALVLMLAFGAGMGWGALLLRA